MFWHTSEHEIYLNKNKFTEVIRKRKISYPDNYVFDRLLKAKNTWLKINLLKQEKNKNYSSR